MTEVRLEKKYAGPYSQWLQNPSKFTTSALLKSVQPDIDRAISAHVGQNNPLLASRARKMTLQAIRSYNPSKAQLSTHIINHLQGLKRVSRQQSQILPVPERVSLDQAYIENARKDLADELGREPSTEELADKTYMSTKRIAYVRKFRTPLSEGYLASANEQSDEGPSMPSIERPDAGRAWVEFVYSDLDHTNKKIMEWTLGLHGERPMSNQQIASKLRLTPGAVSLRKAKIQQMLDQQSLLSPF